MRKLKMNFSFKKIIFALLFLIVLLLVISLLPFFRISQIEIYGLDKVEEEEIFELLQEPIGKPMLFLVGASLENNLLKHPLIGQNKIEYFFPDRMVVTIKERKELVYFPYYGNLLAVSGDGTALKVYQDLPRLQLLFTGLDLPFLAIGEKIPEADLMGKLEKIVDKMDDLFRDMISEIRYTEDYFYLYTTDQYRIRADEHISEQQLNDMRTVIVFMRGQKSKGTVLMQGEKPVFLPD